MLELSKGVLSISGTKRKAQPYIHNTDTKQPKRVEQMSLHDNPSHLKGVEDVTLTTSDDSDGSLVKRAVPPSVPSGAGYSKPSSIQAETPITVPASLASSQGSSGITTLELKSTPGNAQVPCVQPVCSPQAIEDYGERTNSEPFIKLHPDGCSCMRNTQFTRDHGYQLVTPVSVSDHLMFGTWFVRVSLTGTTQKNCNFYLSYWPAFEQVTESEPPSYERNRKTSSASFQITMARDKGSFTSSLNFISDKLKWNKSVMRVAEAAGNHYRAQGHTTPFSSERFKRMLAVAFFNADGAKEHRL